MSFYQSEKELVIAGLRKQRDLLNLLVYELEQSDLDKGMRLMYDQITKKVEENLKTYKRLYFRY